MEAAQASAGMSGTFIGGYSVKQADPWAEARETGIQKLDQACNNSVKLHNKLPRSDS